MNGALWLGITRVGNAWGYSNCCGTESWSVVAHVDGTAGNMNTYCIASLERDCKTGEETLYPPSPVAFKEWSWTGENAYDEISEYVGYKNR